MCNVGSRCAGDMRPQLAKKQEKFRAKSDELAIAESNLIVAKKGNNTRSQKKYANEVSRLKNDVKKLKKEVEHVQRNYDGTATGREELKARMDSSDSSEYPILFDRYVKGGASKNWKSNSARFVVPAVKREVRNLSLSSNLGEGTFSDERVAA